MKHSTYYSDDDKREASVLQNNFLGKEFKVICCTFDGACKTTKDFFERADKIHTEQFDTLDEAENYAEEWVLQK